MLLVPDLYHGELDAHDEMDQAAQLMQSLPPKRAALDMSGGFRCVPKEFEMSRRFPVFGAWPTVRFDDVFPSFVQTRLFQRWIRETP